MFYTAQHTHANSAQTQCNVVQYSTVQYMGHCAKEHSRTAIETIQIKCTNSSSADQEEKTDQKRLG